MTVRKILHMGDPRLRQISVPVSSFDTPELHRLIRDMEDTMAAADGAGLAAIQIGVPQRVVIFGMDHNPRYPEAAPVPRTVLINPVITPQSTAMDEGWEGCLSVPGMRGLVPRHISIRYQGFDQLGRPLDRVAEDFHARVVQHECDHLDGILYPQRIRDLRQFGFIDELVAAGLIVPPPRQE